MSGSDPIAKFLRREPGPGTGTYQWLIAQIAMLTPSAYPAGENR
jgi:hypothetical protein